MQKIGVGVGVVLYLGSNAGTIVTLVPWLFPPLHSHV